MKNSRMEMAVFVTAAVGALAAFGTDANLKYHLTFDDVSNPLAADVGSAATVVSYSQTGGVREQAGLGECSLVTDETIRAGLAAGSEALTIPPGQALRIAHGVDSSRTAPWCVSMRVYVPAITSGSVYQTLFNLFQNAEGDASVSIKKFGEGNYGIGGGGGDKDKTWGYAAIKEDAWHVITCSMDVDRIRLYVDGQLLSDRRFALDCFYKSGSAGRLTLRDRPYIFISGDEDSEDNTLHFDWVKVYDTAMPGEIFGNGISCHTFDGADPLAATIGRPAKIVNYSKSGGVSGADGLGNCSIAADAEVTSGLEPGSKALSIVKGQALRIEHGIATDAMRPWGVSMRVYVPKNTDTATPYNTLLSTHPTAQEDGVICIKRDYNQAQQEGKTYGIGNSRYWSYWPLKPQSWHVFTILTDEKKSSLFIDGELVTTIDSGSYPRVNLKDRPYLFISGDEDGEDALLHFDWVKVFDRALPDDDLISRYATWTESGWVIRDKSTDAVVPGAELDAATEIRLSGETAMSVPKESPVTCARVVVDGTVTLAADLDWRGLGLTPWQVARGAVLDLNGHRLDVASLRAYGSSLSTVSNLDSLQETSGVLCLEVGDVPERNELFNFGGDVKFVKAGAGAFTALVENQLNSGGVEVAAGQFFCGFSPKNGALGAQSSNVRVATGAVFDMWGRTGLERHVLCLDGGTVTSTQCMQLAPTDGENQNWTMGELRMTADSRLEFADMPIQHDVRVQDASTWDLGGHVLDIVFAGKDPDFYTAIEARNVQGLLILNGTVRARGNGFFHDNSIDGTQGGNLDLDCILRLQPANATACSSVCDFRVGRTYTSANLQSTGQLKVYGTFLPDSDYCFQVELRDGAAVDLSTFDSAWPLAFKPVRETVYTTAFVNGANILVKIGTREFTEQTQLVAWAEPPANVTFRLDASPTEKYRLRVRADGLYVLPRRGLIVSIR